MTAAHLYEAYGLIIRTDLELPLRPVSTGIPDVVLRAGTAHDASTVPLEDDPREVVALDEAEDGLWYLVVDDGGHYRFRFYDCGEFIISKDLSSIRWIEQPGGRTHLLPVLFAGTVLAFVLTISGWLVLHASAVSVGGRALAFVGDSGQGKSTLAALAAAHGGRVVSDDVLVVGFDPPRCCGSAGELRLRTGARDLAALFPRGTPNRETVDDRLALLATGVTGWLELGALVVPSPDRDITRPRVTRVPPGEALFLMLSFPRVEGIRAPSLVESTFEQHARLAREVPVYEIDVPWGPPFGDEVVRTLFDLIATEPDLDASPQ